jgi:uncharacterized protein
LQGYEPRTYRERMIGGEFGSYTVCVEETDLWIGIDRESIRAIGFEQLKASTLRTIRRFRGELEGYIQGHREFLESLVPVTVGQEAPASARKMAAAGKSAGTGPMAAVAGTAAELVGRSLASEFQIREIVVENGGDLWVSVVRPLTVSVYAGTSPLSGKMGILVPPECTPLGICTSSGTVGHSLSFGSADAVTIACADAAEADALATAFGNRIHEYDDIDKVIEELRRLEQVVSALIIYRDKAAVCGKCEIRIIHDKS